MSRILAVDDDPDALRLLLGVLGTEHRMTGCATGSEALERLGRESWDLVLVDLTMPAPDGFDVLRFAQRLSPPPPVVVVSGVDRARSTLEALRLGARDFVVKPAAPDEIRAAVERVLETAPALDREPGRYGLIGQSPAIAQIRRLVPLLARSAEMVLIQGETGSGKELFARALHEHGPRESAPFVAHNMAATPAELTESLFFGHLRGAFSGAVADHSGLFEQADSGTLFLDEVDSFPLPLQAKLLRVLETGRVQRLGATAERRVDVRVISASAVDLGALVERNGFRADLYYRLRQVEVVMPPLRERLADVPELVRHFAAEFGLGRSEISFSPAALTLLERHGWPGNCRELRNAVRSAALLASPGSVLPGHLPRTIAAPSATSPAHGPVTLQAIERDHILRTLERAGGNRSRAARLLGIDRGTLARKLRGLGGGERPR